jgi:hypothetical protein
MDAQRAAFPRPLQERKVLYTRVKEGNWKWKKKILKKEMETDLGHSIQCLFPAQLLYALELKKTKEKNKK